MEPTADDRTTRARIRDAAITCFADLGLAATTARKVAAAAGVSPGSIIHHFGSMDGLRAACDRHVAAKVRDIKSEAMAAGGGFDPLAAIRSIEGLPLARYLAKTLVDGSEQVAALLDELVDDAVEYIEAGVSAGLLAPSNHPRERAAILTVWSMGALVLHEHLERLIGIDIAEPITDPTAAAPYVGPALEIYSGLFTEKALEMFGAAFGTDEDAKEHHD